MMGLEYVENEKVCFTTEITGNENIIGDLITKIESTTEGFEKIDEISSISIDEIEYSNEPYKHMSVYVSFVATVSYFKNDYRPELLL